MTEFLLFQPPVSLTNPKANTGGDTYSIGLAYVAAALRQSDVKVRVINNAAATYSIKDILDLVASDSVRIVGLSTLLATIPATVAVARAIKSRFGKKVHVMLGNAYASIDPDIGKRYPYFDTVVTGEADLTVPELARRILAGETVEGSIEATPPDDLDAVPFPAYDLFENTHWKKGTLLPIVGTRGCPHQCGYCARQALSKKVRSRSPENLVAEIKARLPMTRRFYFQDDSATINRNHVLAFCRKLLQSRLVISYEMTTRADCLDDEVVSLLKQSGCRTLLLGVESGSERIRNEVIKKRLTDKEIFDGVAVCKRRGLAVQLFFMIGHPQETQNDVMASLNYPLKLWKLGLTNIETVGYHVTLPIPTTPYFTWCVQKGKISPNLVDDYITGKLGDGYFGHWPYLVPDGMTEEDLLRSRAVGNRQFHLRASYAYRRLLRDLSHPEDLMADLKHAYYLLKHGGSSDISKLES
ncbi:MAG: radical SAM protein [Verrucomicrobiia bacterium]|jgi:radical SAM superfamily enzyme YgiQ (UPF0313 family)